MQGLQGRVEADRVVVEDGCVVEAGAVVRGEEVVLRRGARIAAGTQIDCDRLELGPGCRVAGGGRIVCPEITLEEGASLGPDLNAELNEYLHLGRHGSVGARVAIVGQGMRAGEFLWMKGDIIIGGGGARGPRSYLTIGDRSSIFDRAFINLSEEVRIGSGSALSFNVVVMTHGAWQPVLQGYRASFGPVTIGDRAVVYVNSVIMPGVSVGDYATVAAGSVVLQDVPAHCLAAGSPARIRRGPEGYPARPSDAEVDALLGEVLRDYATTLPPKGARVAWTSGDGRVLTVELDGRRETVAYLPRTGPPPAELGPDGAPTLVLGHGDAGRAFPGAVYFDLASETVTGDLSPLGEDLRDYLRRWTLRFFNGHPFRTLPQANLQRLKARAAASR